MNRSTICKLSIALALCCAIIGGISIAPLAVALVFVIFTILCLLGCVFVFITGLFVWLFSAGQVNLFSLASSIANFGLGIFHFISPIATFSFHYITPIAGWIAFGVGILGIIISSVGISKAKKQLSETEDADSEALAETDEMPDGNKKKRKRKRKTDKDACVASLVISIVFTALAIIGLIVAPIAITMFN